MQTFKCFFKVVYANLTQTIVITGIFVVMAVLMGLFGGGQDSIFERTSANIGIVNRDRHPISLGLLEYLETLHRLVPMEDDMLALEDAIFFEQVRYVLIIDEGFGANFASGDESFLWNIAAPHNNAVSVFIERQIDVYMQTIRGYLAARFTYEQAAYLTRHDLRQEVNIISAMGNLIPSRYFDAMVFIMLSMIVSSLAPALIVFKKADISRRLEASPEAPHSRTAALTLGSICLALIVWVMIMIPAHFLHHESLLSLRGGLHMLNSFVLASMCVAAAVLIVQLTDNMNVVIGATIMLSVTLGFASGAFVPIAIMSEQMLTIVQFTPAFWYGQNNLLLIEALLGPIYMPDFWLGIGIQMGFTAALFAITLVLGSEREKLS